MFDRRKVEGVAVVDPNGTAQSHMYALRAGTLLHEFRIDAVLGHGGFGITYRAFDTDLHKAVAIKEYLPNELAGRASDTTVRAKSRDDQRQFEDGVIAFLDEARLVARLQHKNIMEVHRFFKLNGTGYIVLRYEQGRSLKQRLDEGPLAEAELRKVLGGLLDGIEVLHNEAILHRDIKPSNIILSDSRVPGERGVPVLIDFGAARDFRSRHSRSVTTIVAPGYAPPEQYGVGGQAGPWSDLYALGATAYRCVTGQAPPEALRRLRKDPYVPAIEVAAGRYDASLLDMIDRMLSVEEEQRPQSAAEVKAALNSRGVLRSRPKPILTRDGRPAVAGAMDAARTPSRSRRLAGILASVVAAAVIASGAVLWLDGTLPKFIGKNEVKTAAAPAASNAAIPGPTAVETPKTEAAPKAAEAPNAEAPVKMAEFPKVAAPKQAAAASVQVNPPPVVKRTLVDAVAAGFEPVADTRRETYVTNVVVAFSPDSHIVASGSNNNTIKLWDVASGRELRTLAGHGDNVRSVAFSPDGRTLASGSSDQSIKLWDVASGRELRTLKQKLFQVMSVAFSPDGRTVASGAGYNYVTLWDVASGRPLRTLQHPDQVNSVAFSADGRTLASGAQDRTIKLWDVASGRELRTLRHGERVFCVTFSPDSRTLASAGYDGKINLWDVASGRELRTLVHTGGISSTMFSRDGRILASASSDDTIKLWDVASGRELRTFKGGFLVALSPDSRTLVSDDQDRTIRLWSVADGSLQARYIGMGELGSITFDGKGLPMSVSGNEDAVYHFVKGGKTFKPSEMRAMGYDLPTPNPKN